ncbi:hypothetical protein PBY51_005888 [Eleginops maclovinus]|uniref:Uncharacterized protein n=1 Tax=Eleginops maclovinus TaxID=56733 RepID=A0AAN7WTR7_ELEMC|nr:hypothetical protein PBY51_005888 [Eleginops maclovinus]
MYNMEQNPQTRTVSKTETLEMILEEETSELDQFETPDLSAAESEKQLRLFVTLLTVKVMSKCHALKNRSQEDWTTHTKRLVNKTMEGLAITKGFCPDVRSTKEVCKDVLKDLQKKFCSKRQLESLILSQQPAVEAAIVQCMQANIKKLSTQLATKDSSSWKEDLLKVLFIAGLLVAFALIVLIR